MSDQYIFEQPIFEEDIQYQREINNKSNKNKEENNIGLDLTDAKITTMTPITYQLNENQSFYAQPNQIYANKINFQKEERSKISQYQMNETNKENENYLQNSIPQESKFYQLIPQKLQNNNINQQKDKNIRKTEFLYSKRQPPQSSRNPYLKSQSFQQPIMQLNNEEKNIHPQIEENIMEKKYIQQNNNLEPDKLLIEEDFQPDIPLVNSILSMSQIPYELKENENSEISQNIEQIQQKQIKSKVKQTSYAIPKRNPNLNIRQYEYSDNDSHFVTTADPGSRTVVLNKNINSKQLIKKENTNTINKFEKESSFISKKFSEENFNSTQNERNYEDKLFSKKNDYKKEIESSYLMENIDMEEIKNIKNVKVKKIKNTNFNNFGPEENNFFIEDNSDNDELEKENPIEEKIPDESNMDTNINNNFNFQQEKNKQNGENEIIDIDDNLDDLPTINDILKGNFEILPPPKKKKYQ